MQLGFGGNQIEKWQAFQVSALQIALFQFLHLANQP